MRRYETFVIIDPDVSAERREEFLTRVSELISQMDGVLVLTDEWGDRKLAYEVKKKARGYYVRFDYCGSGTLVNEIERFFRIDDRALKYMTVLLDKQVDLQKIEDEKASAEAQKDSEDAAEAEQTADKDASQTADTEPPEAEDVADETQPNQIEKEV
jgi:small subunit ribosomal protein S6